MDLQLPTLPTVSPPPMAAIALPTLARPAAASAALPEFPVGDIVKKSTKKFKEKEDQLAYEVHSLIPESALLSELTAADKALDIALKKRQLAVQEALPDVAQRKNTVPRILRMCIYHTFDQFTGQYHTDPDIPLEMHRISSWTLRIEGRLLEDPKAVTRSNRKFSSFFKRIYVQLDQNEFPDNWIVEWNKATSAEETDGFEIRRKSSSASAIHVMLSLDYAPERYQVSKFLTEALSMKAQTFTKTEVILSLWHYVRNHKLQDNEHRSTVLADQTLKNVFGVEKFDYNDIPRLLQAHLSPPEPLHLIHQLKFTGDPGDHEQWFDIPVWIENQPFQIPLNSHKSEIDKLEDEIIKDIQSINEKKRKRDVLLEFAQNPTMFVDDYISSCIRDFRVAASAGKADPEFEKRTEFFSQPLMTEFIPKYIESRPALGGGSLGRVDGAGARAELDHYSGANSVLTKGDLYLALARELSL